MVCTHLTHPAAPILTSLAVDTGPARWTVTDVAVDVVDAEAAGLTRVAGALVNGCKPSIRHTSLRHMSLRHALNINPNHVKEGAHSVVFAHTRIGRQ